LKSASDKESTREVQEDVKTPIEKKKGRGKKS